MLPVRQVEEMMDAACVVDGSDRLGECPIWDDLTGWLYWIDIRGPALHRYNPSSGEVVSSALPELVGSIAFRSTGGLIAGMKSGLSFLDADTGALTPIADLERDKPNNRCNDGRCDRRGRFWVGTLDDVRRQPDGALYRLDPDLNCTKHRDGVIVPNSIAWSPDDATMYFADTPLHRILAFDYDIDSGRISSPRVFTDEAAYPDGSAVDTSGCLWNAEYGRGRIVRYTPTGKIDRVIDMPVSQPTCCAFGGNRLDTLFVTSASQRLAPEDLANQPLAGALFAINVGHTGMTESRFGG